MKFKKKKKKKLETWKINSSKRIINYNEKIEREREITWSEIWWEIGDWVGVTLCLIIEPTRLDRSSSFLQWVTSLLSPLSSKPKAKAKAKTEAEAFWPQNWALSLSLSQPLRYGVGMALKTGFTFCLFVWLNYVFAPQLLYLPRWLGQFGKLYFSFRYIASFLLDSTIYIEYSCCFLSSLVIGSFFLKISFFF